MKMTSGNRNGDFGKVTTVNGQMQRMRISKESASENGNTGGKFN